MKCFRLASLLALLLALLVTPPPSAGQVRPPQVTGDPCPEPNSTLTNACQLGQPTAMGTAVQGLFHSPDDVDAYRFEVPAPGATAYITLSDLWYEGGLRLVDGIRGAVLAESDRKGQAQGQLLAPEVITLWLEPSSFAAIVSAGVDDWAGAEAHSYTLRVALGPRTASPGVEGSASSSDRGYSLTLSIEPAAPTTHSMVTFTATVNPPFTDLFDFSWTLDGQALRDGSPVVQVPRPAVGSHAVSVVARGARYYPDPSLPELPPTLSATGSFEVR